MAHLSRLEAHSFQCSERHVALVGELRQATDDPVSRRNTARGQRERPQDFILKRAADQSSDSPSRTGLPVRSIKTREGGNKITAVGCTDRRSQLLCRGQKDIAWHLQFKHSSLKKHQN